MPRLRMETCQNPLYLKRMKRCIFLLLLLARGAGLFAQKQHSAYFPTRGQWEHRRPASLGLDSAQLAEAIRYARENESKMPRDQDLAQAESFGKNEPFDEPVGPLKDRGG